MNERRQLQAEQALWPQPVDAERSVDRDAGVGDTWQQKRVGPDHDTGRHSRNGARRGPAPPKEPAEYRRRELGNGGKRQQPNGGELSRAGKTVIDIGKKQDGENGDAADGEELRSGVAWLPGWIAATRERERYHNVVRYHDGERHRLDNH